jgi:hypothetical protein
MMSAYKDLTDALPSKIGRPNKFGIPPAYFDAQKEPLVDECRALFDVMEAPPANAQKSATPFKDVVDLASTIARAKGLDAANAEAAGRISLGLFFAETNGNQNVGTSPSDGPTGQEHLRPFAKFLMRCGSSIANLNERFPSSTRSRRGETAGYQGNHISE